MSIRQLTVVHKIFALVIVFTAGLAGIVAIAHRTVGEVKVGGPLYADIVRGKDLIADILPPPEYIIESYLVTLQAVAEERPDETAKLLKRFKQLRADFATRHEVWAKELADGEMKHRLLVESYEPAQRFYQILDEQFLPAMSSGDKAKAREAAYGPMRDAYEQHRAQIDQVVALANQFTAETESQSKVQLRSGLYWLFGMAGGVLVIVLCVSALIGRSIAGAVRRLAAELSEGFGQVAVASGQVASGSQVLAQGASEQAAALEESSSALEEMSSMTKKNSETAQEAAALSEQATASADKSNQAMSQMGAAINQIQKSATETAKIIKVIDEIAFQTNLLALNAAVEAARAGEAGKGFAVVAEEVRNLAMRSAEAAKNTAAMIEESVNSAKNGVAISSEVAGSLEEITQANKKMNVLVAEIAASSREQAQGITQMNAAVGQVDKATQSAAANAEESAAAAEELSAQAEQMTGVVRDLLALVGGVRDDAEPALPGVARQHAAPTKRARPASLKSPKPSQQFPLDDSENQSDFSEFGKTA